MMGIFLSWQWGMILLVLIFVMNFPIHITIGTSFTITACSCAVGYALRGNIRTGAGLPPWVSALHLAEY